MFSKHTLFVLFGILTITANAQDSKKDLDRKAIQEMCGCYKVTFKYTETFSSEVDYEKAYDYQAEALEWAYLIEDTEDKLSIQHLLIVRDNRIVKHWRQDWEYENTNVFAYNKDNSWDIKKLNPEDVKGQWTQKVYQVDDSPRYSGSATWIHADGKSYWENKSSSPLPRREHTKRDDYNVMLRGNRHEITATGWVHEQDNDKVIREDGKEDVLLVQEKGFNIYTKVAESECQPAIDWWMTNKDFWANVRTEWDKLLNERNKITIKKEVDEKPLLMFLSPKNVDNSSAAIQQAIDKYISE